MVSSHFTTDDVAPADAFAYWREVICAVYVQLRADPGGQEPFSGSVRARDWSDVTISRVTAGSQTVTHPESDQRDDCLVSIQMEGTGVISQAGRSAVLRPGDFGLYDATRPYSLSFDKPFSQIVVQFPRSLLVDRSIDLDRAVATRGVAGEGLTDVVSGLVSSLDAQEDEMPAAVRMRLGMQVVDCLASALTVQGFGASVPGIEPSTRQQLVLDYVSANVRNPNLSVATTARAFGLTTRSLQLLFADGPSLNARIRSLRLERAADALANPLLLHQTIARIGADHGFGDPASFARAFRRHFGHSPSEHRAHAAA